MRKLVVGLVAVLLVAAAAAAWLLAPKAPQLAGPASGPASGGTNVPQGERPPIVIGLAGPFTGPQAAFGEQMQLGARFAVQIINSNGGVEGRKITLVEKDDACDPDQARSVAADLIAQKAVAVIGHFCSAASEAAFSLYEPAKVVMISPGSSDPRLTRDNAGKGVFRTVWRDDYQGLIAAALIKQTLAGKKFGVVRDDTLYGQQLVELFKGAVARLGMGDLAADLVLAPGLSPRQAAAKVRSAGLGVVYVAAGPETAGGFVKALREAGVTATILGPDALSADVFARTAGAAADGTIITFARNPLDYPTASRVIDLMTRDGKDPSGYVLPSFAAAQVISAAMKQSLQADPAGSVDGARLAGTIHGNGFTTVFGDIAFDERGDLTKPGVVYYVWKGGKLTVM